MDLPQYFANIAEELDTKSKAIRRDFASHRPTAGGHRESLLATMLRNYLPREFGIDTGLVASSDGQFSNQADLIVIDHSWNAPFYPSGPSRIWLVEAVYAMIEVKTNISPTELADSINKCRRFKQLRRKFSEAPTSPAIQESVFVLWSFESPKAETLKQNLVEALRDLPVTEQPDFVVVPGQLVATCGSYRELSALGQPGSSYRQNLEKQYGPHVRDLVDWVQIAECGKDSLLVWLIWFLSWLKRAGSRNSELLSYLPAEKAWGRRL